MNSSRIEVHLEHLQKIRTHAERTYPEECCGLLIGKINKNCKTVTQVWETENSWNEEAAETFAECEGVEKQDTSKRHNFSIAPEVMLQAQKAVRDRQLNIIGIYHSHPDYPAEPSEFDRAIAWQQYSYIIVSVPQGRAATLQSWTLDDRDRFQLEEIVTVKSTANQNEP
ncbi:MAG: M67 family metallopeptidase [Oscillatoria sp. PMC 1051.18]|nr:M67 family metallopeptidase [Oscillatoria sp. PMC 1050.18]MEC5031243.1 M67 family metallopeptidase [Oscillatoria sp. PMC 1051.18]